MRVHIIFEQPMSPSVKLISQFFTPDYTSKIFKQLFKNKVYQNIEIAVHNQYEHKGLIQPDDVLHLIGVNQHPEIIKAKNKKILSPLIYPLMEVEKCKQVIKLRKDSLPEEFDVPFRMYRDLCNTKAFDYLMPFSITESSVLTALSLTLMGTDFCQVPIRVVNPYLYHFDDLGKIEELRKIDKPTSILCQGGLFVQNNQLNFLLAMEDLYKKKSIPEKYKVMLIGENPYSCYSKAVMEVLGRINGPYCESVSLGTDNLAQVYANTALFVDPSWFNILPIDAQHFYSVSDRPMILTNRGSNYETFWYRSSVSYVNPNSISEIAFAIKKRIKEVDKKISLNIGNLPVNIMESRSIQTFESMLSFYKEVSKKKGNIR